MRNLLCVVFSNASPQACKSAGDRAKGVISTFNLAARSSFDVDEIYWKFLHEEGRGEAMLDDAVLARKGEFLKRKKDQFEAYWTEKQNDKRFD